MTGAIPQRLSGTPAAPRQHPVRDGQREQLTGDPGATTWPHDLSHDASMRISDVLAALRPEFPSVTPSKLRFWEEQGLIEPRRTAAGYRQYSPADVARLRFVLEEQRDRYTPLRVIKEELERRDAQSREPAAPPRLIADQGVTTAAGRRIEGSDFASRAGITLGQFTELAEIGAVHVGADGRVDVGQLAVAQACVALAGFGIDGRHVRSLRATAQRQAELVGQAISASRSSRTTAAATSDEAAAELVRLLSVVHHAWLRQAVENTD